MKQFIVSEANILKRKDFYDYLKNNYSLKILYPFEKEKFINSKYPFVVDFKENNLWIVENITCLACAVSSKKIISIEEFKKLERK